jgi:predicted phosphodiesterase
VRIALLSDIHGNLPALDAVLADIRSQGPFDQIVVAGDLAWAGPWPAEVVDRVRDLGAAVIQGNTDAFFAYRPDDPPEDKQESRFGPLQAWLADQLGAERVAYLLKLPFSHRISAGPGCDLLVVHANPRDLDRAIDPRLAETDLDELLGPPEHCDWQALAFGHVHVPYARSWHGRLLVDVASAGLPLDGDRRAAYAIITSDGTAWQAEHRRVFYEVPWVVRQMQTGGLPRGKHFADRLLRAGQNG